MDLGFSGCFMDSNFIASNELPYQAIVPLPIALIDSTVNACMIHTVSLPIDFACSYLCISEFFVTKLEETYPIILRHN